MRLFYAFTVTSVFFELCPSLGLSSITLSPFVMRFVAFYIGIKGKGQTLSFFDRIGVFAYFFGDVSDGLGYRPEI